MKYLTILVLMLSFSVIMCGTEPEKNTAPVISSITANPSPVDVGVTCTLTAVATDTDGDDLTYTWSCDSGTLSSTTGISIEWTAPGTSGTYSITCTVSDGKTTDSKAVYINVTRTVTDIDENVYQIVQIGDQEWMVENLKVTRYRNGDAIPNVTDGSAWGGLSTGAYCTYYNNASNAAVYGHLYNWYAVDDSRGLAPEGWHVPTDEEWKELEMYLGMSQSEADTSGWRGTDEGDKLKETGTSHWGSPNAGATNESGFTALPGGYRSISTGTFLNFYHIAIFWSSTES
ncbi:FISUMP domain-containing protein, partial [candidate division KSB1 bacterium]